MPQGPQQYRKKWGGGGGGSLQNKVHMTFLVDKIDMWRFPKLAKTVVTLTKNIH